MDELTERDWGYLSKISHGNSRASSIAKSSRQRLENLGLVLQRPHDYIALTGRGLEALIRRKHQLQIPPEPDELAAEDAGGAQKIGAEDAAPASDSPETPGPPEEDST